MIKELNENHNKKFKLWLIIFIAILMTSILCSLVLGQYKISVIEICKMISNLLFGTEHYINETSIKVVSLIRIPRTIAAFIVGSSLAVSGSIFQSTFNNKLVSPDVLGVSAGACVGAALAIILNVNIQFISIFAFIFGLISVLITLALPKLFKNSRTIALVLAGIIVGSLMNSILGLLKYLADQENKLAEITFWIMGELAGVTYADIMIVLPIYVLTIIGVMSIRWKINILSLGQDEAISIGLNYKLYRFIFIVFSTVLTAAAISLSGNVGWVGLVIPHITRALVGGNNRYSIPIAMLSGGSFMILVDLLARNLSVDEIPLSIITGLIGTVIYTIVLIKRGDTIND